MVNEEREGRRMINVRRVESGEEIREKTEGETRMINK